MTKEEIFLLRRRKGIKLTQISKEINCSISNLSRYENGKVEMSHDKVIKYKNYIINY